MGRAGGGGERNVNKPLETGRNSSSLYLEILRETFYRLRDSGILWTFGEIVSIENLFDHD